ncbi:toxin-antitoxin system YwqK family antitoxin [Niabella ginsengisoli]|uniref:Toxin-antitoxin system YwqK family antitoxin n=1 Tax=Niabella ginsengisoli TaxID=522298 RepID=A0ABS9SHU6_9BACT|nr:hypothetical protein [Niabella ginsengisoli]MCH5597891.1 hypothetical protein [Niabella ginsengisoli]
MKIYTVILALLVHFCLKAQEVKTVNWDQVKKTYNKDSSKMILTLNNIPLHGVYKEKFDDGGYGLYNIKNGMITGDVLWYSIADKLSARITYKDGVRHGKKENYDGEGKIWLKQEYLNGREHGCTEMLSNTIRSVTCYKMGKKEGLSSRYINGVISSEENYKNGLQDGVSRTYANGKIISETNYKTGLKDGPSRTYANGSIAMEIIYKDGKRNGLMTMYANEKKTQDATYLNDIRHGESHMYKQDGSVLFTNYYLNDEKVTREEFEKENHP